MKEGLPMKRNLLMTLMMVIVCVGLYVDTAFAANTSIGSAKQVAFGKKYSDSITKDISKRYYKIVLPSSGKINFDIEGENDCLDLYLYDAEGEKITSTGEYKSSVTDKTTIEINYYLTGGTYYFAIQGYDWGVKPGDYQYQVDFTSANESFSETGEGTDNNINQAHNIMIGNTYRGQIAMIDAIDYYVLSIPSSGEITFNIEGENDCLDLFLYDVEGERISLTTEYKSNVTDKTTIEINYCLTGGTYYFAIQGYDWGIKPGNYQFTTSFVSANESFVETHKDDYLTGANSIVFNTTYRGQIAYNNDDTDYYEFKVKKKDTIEIMMSADEKGTVYIYNPEGKNLWSESISYDSQTGKCTLSRFIEISPGTYYFRVKSSNTGNYSFKISSYNETKKPAKVTLSSVKSTKKKVASIKWKRISDANGYQIQCSTSKKFKSKKTVTASRSATKKTIKKLSSKKKYYVRIRAYKNVAGKKKYGSWSKVKSVKIR